MTTHRKPDTTVSGRRDLGRAEEDRRVLDEISSAQKLYERYLELARLAELPTLAEFAADSGQPVPSTERPLGLVLDAHVYRAPPLGLQIDPSR